MTSVHLRRCVSLLIGGVLICCSPRINAEDCSAITKYGIFDVSTTHKESQLVDDLVKWLSTNEYQTEADAKKASLKVGITIPGIDVPMNLDGTYGESHSKTWSKATMDYLQHNVQFHDSVSQKFKTANPNIIAAWQACVTQAKGLICWATQTKNRSEILLNMEVRAIVFPLPVAKLKVTSLKTSDNVTADAAQWKGVGLNTSPTPILFKRHGAQASDGANFTVFSNSDAYRCNADVPELPPLAPVWKTTSKKETTSIPCRVGRLSMTGDGPVLHGKHQVGSNCQTPEGSTITSVKYDGCYENEKPGGPVCNFFQRYGEYDQLVGNKAHLVGATNSADPMEARWTLTFEKTTTTQECIKNCPAQ